jgi:hypothetical protein
MEPFGVLSVSIVRYVRTNVLTVPICEIYPYAN